MEFNPDKPIHNEAGILTALQSSADRALFVRGLRELAWKGERLRQRYENSCSYQWATGESYERGTEMVEKAIFALARDCGLHCFLQTDPRGATVYVSRDPIDPSRYSTDAHCIFYGDE